MSLQQREGSQPAGARVGEAQYVTVEHPVQVEGEEPTRPRRSRGLENPRRTVTVHLVHQEPPCRLIAVVLSSVHRPLTDRLRRHGGSWCTRCTVTRSEEHTSELQSHSDLVCRLLLEKKK